MRRPTNVQITSTAGVYARTYTQYYTHRNIQPAQCTFPVTRRIANAVLLAKGPELALCMPSQDVAAAQRSVRRHFLRLLAEGRARKNELVHFFHIPKTGGTSICKLALRHYGITDQELKSSQCHVREFGDFGSWADFQAGMKVCCWDVLQGAENPSQHITTIPHLPTLSFAQRQYWMRSHWIQSDEQFPHATCAERARICNARHLQIHANEYVLPDAGDARGTVAHVCSQFINMVILRNPVSRAVSNIMHLHQMFGWNNASARFPSTFQGIADLAPRVVNNMYIRALLGQQVTYRH